MLGSSAVSLGSRLGREGVGAEGLLSSQGSGMLCLSRVASPCCVTSPMHSR